MRFGGGSLRGAQRQFKKGLDFPVWNNLPWWGRGDSNPHASRHMILSHARLPIPTLPRTYGSLRF